MRNLALVSSFFASLFLFHSRVLAQTKATGSVPVSMIVTHEVKGSPVSELNAQDLVVEQGKEGLRVSALVPAGRNQATVDLLFLIDDSARGSFGTQVQDLKQFVSGLPENFRVGIGYMRNGTNAMASPFTRDHQAAANSIRLALGAGGADVSPYDSLSEAIKLWPEGNAERREVIMISSGIEALGGGYTSDNPYVNRGIEDAQKAAIVVFTINNPSSGLSGRFYWRSTWGQNFLSQLADETGGEAYNINMGQAVSIQPFLNEILQQLSHQYILTFAAPAENKSRLERVKISLKEEKGSIAAASKAYIKAGL